NGYWCIASDQSPPSASRKAPPACRSFPRQNPSCKIPEHPRCRENIRTSSPRWKGASPSPFPVRREAHTSISFPHSPHAGFPGSHSIFPESYAFINPRSTVFQRYFRSDCDTVNYNENMIHLQAESEKENGKTLSTGGKHAEYTLYHNRNRHSEKG